MKDSHPAGAPSISHRQERSHVAEHSRELVLRLARALGAELVETHISWILLTPALAFKLKKPVRLPFLDYSTAERRRIFCEEEVRLNRRLAASLYEGISRVTGSAQAPGIDTDGPTLDYAVRMKRFPAGALFSERLKAGSLGAQEVDRFAHRLATFHAKATSAAADIDPVGDLPLRRAQAALSGARSLFSSADAHALAAWLEARWRAVQHLWQQRVRAGKIREGHGDLHLANIVAWRGEVMAFDCIEFDPSLRSLDIVDDAAFALMDFAARGRPDLGWRFFNAWLEHSGEYEGLGLLRFYLVSHALVRAQVEHLRAPDDSAAPMYARTALEWSRLAHARLVITYGLPGSGKTYASQRLLEHDGAIRIRSDVERKRLLGLDLLADTRAEGFDAYNPTLTHQTYARLLALARVALQEGLPVVLDAAFLRRSERVSARALAEALQRPFAILACEAPMHVLRERLRLRSGDASEANEAVLEQLLAVAEPLTASEQNEVIASA